jgi:hypothetical protein
MSEISGVAKVTVVESYDLDRRELVKKTYDKAAVKLVREGTQLRISRSEVVTSLGDPINYMFIEEVVFDRPSLKSYNYDSSTYINEIPIPRDSFLTKVQKIISSTEYSDQYKYQEIAKLVDEERKSNATSIVRLVLSDYEGLQIIKSIEIDENGNQVVETTRNDDDNLPWWSKISM